MVYILVWKVLFLFNFGLQPLTPYVAHDRRSVSILCTELWKPASLQHLFAWLVNDFHCIWPRSPLMNSRKAVLINDHLLSISQEPGPVLGALAALMLTELPKQPYHS